MANQRDQEEGCFAVSFERKYYHRPGIFIKRTLRPREFRSGYRGIHVPRLNKNRLMNEAAALRYIRDRTDIPVQTVYCDFEDDEAYYLITEYVEGVGMSDLADAQKDVVQAELQRHLHTLHMLVLNRIGDPTGIMIPPYCVMRHTENDEWKLQAADYKNYPFCHNHLSQHSIIVDQATLKIKAIVDWEHAGFYPAFFE